MKLESLKTKVLTVFILLLTTPVILMLASCDSADSVTVTEVKTVESLSDKELKQYQGLNSDKQIGYIHFGFDLRSSPQEDIAQYLPLMNYLSKVTGYQFKLEVTPKNSNIIDELKAGNIQLAAMGAVSDIRAEELGLATTLVQGLNKHNKASYQSMFIVRPDSQINSVADIKQTKMAFGDESSTQGHLIPRIILQKNSIKLSDFAEYGYLGSHQLCAEAVVSGKYDVCALQDQMAKDLAKRGMVKIIHTSKYYPSSGIVVSTALPSSAAAAIKEALLKFDPHGRHKVGLYNWHKTEMPNGFVEADEANYKDLRDWLKKLDLL